MLNASNGFNFSMWFTADIIVTLNILREYILFSMLHINAEWLVEAHTRV